MRGGLGNTLGFLFLAIDLILLAYALLGNLEASAAIINERCGLAMIIFGAGCLALLRLQRPGKVRW